MKPRSIALSLLSMIVTFPLPAIGAEDKPTLELKSLVDGKHVYEYMIEFTGFQDANRGDAAERKEEAVDSTDAPMERESGDVKLKSTGTISYMRGADRFSVHTSAEYTGEVLIKDKGSISRIPLGGRSHSSACGFVFKVDELGIKLDGIQWPSEVIWLAKSLRTCVCDNGSLRLPNHVPFDGPLPPEALGKGDKKKEKINYVEKDAYKAEGEIEYTGKGWDEFAGRRCYRYGVKARLKETITDKKLGPDADFEMEGDYYFAVEEGFFAGYEISAILSLSPSETSNDAPLFTGGSFRLKLKLLSVENIGPGPPLLRGKMREGAH